MKNKKSKALVNTDKISNEGIDIMYDLLEDACFEINNYQSNTPQNKHGQNVMSLFVELFGSDFVQIMMDEIHYANK